MRARPQTDNSKALAAFIAAKAEIDTMLARLQALSDDQFGADPEAINWADVVTIQNRATLLREITDMACKEGEYAA